MHCRSFKGYKKIRDVEFGEFEEVRFTWSTNNKCDIYGAAYHLKVEDYTTLHQVQWKYAECIVLHTKLKKINYKDELTVIENNYLRRVTVKSFIRLST